MFWYNTVHTDREVLRGINTDMTPHRASYPSASAASAEPNRRLYPLICLLRSKFGFRTEEWNGDTQKRPRHRRTRRKSSQTRRRLRVIRRARRNPTAKVNIASPTLRKDPRTKVTSTSQSTTRPVWSWAGPRPGWMRTRHQAMRSQKHRPRRKYYYERHHPLIQKQDC